MREAAPKPFRVWQILDWFCILETAYFSTLRLKNWGFQLSVAVSVKNLKKNYQPLQEVHCFTYVHSNIQESKNDKIFSVRGKTVSKIIFFHSSQCLCYCGSCV